MIEVLAPGRGTDTEAKLTEVFRLRHRVFRERLGWKVNSNGGLERDRFDDLGPVYLLARDDDGLLVGTWRLLPTTGDYMLKSVFPQLLEDAPAPAKEDLWETSRFAVDSARLREPGPRGVSRVTSELFCGLVEHCLASGIREVVQVYDIRIARLLPRIGCAPAWQSRCHRIDSTVALAGRFTTDRKALARIRRAGGIARPVLLSADVEHPAKAA